METKDIIKNLRKNHGYTVKQVASGTGISENVYPKYESGILNAGVPVLVKIADFYGVSVDYLLGREPASPLLDIPTKPVDDDEFVRLYESLPEFAKEIFVEVMAKLAQAQQTKAKKQAEEKQSKPDIQRIEGQNLAVARTSDPDKLYRPAPTEEQMKQFDLVTPDMLGEDE